MLGCDNAKIAEILGISEQTFYVWLKKNKSFSEAIKAGTIDADADVASSLYKSAVGVKRTIEKEIVVKDGPDQTHLEIAELVVQEPPNVAAAIFWLKNRHKDKWRDIRSSELSGPGGAAIELNTTNVIPVKQLSRDERATLRAFLESHITDVVDENEESADEKDDSEGDQGDA